jgi:hypothetical protein
MNARILRGALVIVAVILAGGVWTQAQAQSVNIGFNFVAGGKTLEAGTYSVDFGPNGVVLFTPAKGGAAVEVPRVKTLGKRNVRKVELVFDMVGSARFLSEVWLPEKGGCLVGRHADSQEQQTVKGDAAKTGK